MLASTIRARKLMEASESGSVQLLKEKKQVKGSKNDLLESIGGVSGQDQRSFVNKTNAKKANRICFSTKTKQIGFSISFGKLKQIEFVLVFKGHN